MEKLDIPQGTLDLMILTILAREPMHGYGISQRLAALSHDNFQVNPGSLFPSLYRLEQDGKLKAEWRRQREQPQGQVLPADGVRAEAARTASASAGIGSRSRSPACWRAHDAAASPRIDRCAGCRIATRRNASSTTSSRHSSRCRLPRRCASGVSPAAGAPAGRARARRRRAGQGARPRQPPRRLARRGRPRRALRRPHASADIPASRSSSC